MRCGWSALCLVLIGGTFVAAEHVAVSTDPSVLAIQNEIAALDGSRGFYATTYRRYEALSWMNLPAWMRQDAAKHRVVRVLDIGCGYGTLLALAAKIYHAEPYCMDVTRYIPEFGKRHGFHFARGNIQLDPNPWPSTFEAILLTEVLEHFNFQPVPTLNKIRGMLSPGGVLFLTTPDSAEWGKWTRYYSRLEDLPAADSSKRFIDDHIWLYSKDELIKVVTDAGFRIEQFAYSPGVGHRHFNLVLRIGTAPGHRG